MKRHRYGWIRDAPDQRDRVFRARRPGVIPRRVDLRPLWPGILDQGNLGSCVWNALSYHFLFCLAKQSTGIFQPSRLFGYYNTRKMEGTVDSDAGCVIRNAIKSLAKHGVCDERDWRYRVQAFAEKPPLRCYQRAKDHQALEYFRLPQDLWAMKDCLAEGFPFVVGIGLYESFESAAVARTGKAPLPGPDEQFLGGHAVTVVGYDDAAQRFTLANSWGPEWGERGFFTLPYAYLQKPELAADLWTIRLVEG